MKLLLFTSLLMGACYVHGLTSSLQQITDNIGSNPSNVGFYIYVPTTRQSRPAIVVAVHACHGKAQDVYSGTQYASLADQYGFIVIYPNSPNSADSCWDVSSSASLTHNGGGDSLGIVNMAKWTMNKYNGDSGRIFVTGTSSGAMMTNLLLGAYPDVFAAGVAFAGVPYGCFAGPSADYWNSQCATGQNIKTAQQWGDLVRSAYSGYSGKRPKLLEFHGTADATLYYQNLLEENKQWSNVFGISFTRNNTNTPISGYTEMVFGDGSQYKAYSAAGVTHNIPTREGDVMNWFGLPGSPSTGTTTTITTKTTTTSSKPATTTTSGSSTGGAAHYAQCGGIGYTGPTSCVSPYTCQYSNAYYSQCL